MSSFVRNKKQHEKINAYKRSRTAEKYKNTINRGISEQEIERERGQGELTVPTFFFKAEKEVNAPSKYGEFTAR